MMDAAWFQLSGYINSQNTSHQYSENPHAIHQIPLHTKKLAYGVLLSARRMIGQNAGITLKLNMLHLRTLQSEKAQDTKNKSPNIFL
jgi:hypothetical protein